MAKHLVDPPVHAREAGSNETSASVGPLGRRKELLILRHAKSSWSNEGLQDFDRPLNERGRAAAPLMGRFISSLIEQPVDCVLVSAAKRTRQTWDLLGLEGGLSRPPMFLDSLYLADPVTIAKALRDYVWPKARRVLLIGHNPGLQAFCLAATMAWPGEQDQGASARLAQKFPTAALARFALNGAWQSLGPKPGEEAGSPQANLEAGNMMPGNMMPGLNLADLRLTGFESPRELQLA